MTPEQYKRIIGNLRGARDSGEKDEEGQEEKERPEVHFVYSSGIPEEPILRQLKAEFPTAVFLDLRGVEEGLRYLAESSIMITSGSSYSVMAGYLCNGCRVIFAKPKEYKGNPMTEENYTKNYYYVQGWEPVWFHFHGNFYLSDSILASLRGELGLTWSQTWEEPAVQPPITTTTINFNIHRQRQHPPSTPTFITNVNPPIRHRQVTSVPAVKSNPTHRKSKPPHRLETRPHQSAAFRADDNQETSRLNVSDVPYSLSFPSECSK
ncbi:hypothetical protein BGZ74_001798, partial [Mortierella antarctica]